MDTITLRFLISLTVSKGLDICIMDVIIAYLYGSIDNDIHMKIHKGFKLPEANNQSLVVCAQSNYNDLYMD